MLRVLFCGGGSVGHLAPSVAVWEEIQKKEPNAKELFVCSYKKEDRAFLAGKNIEKISIAAPKLTGEIELILFPILFPLACLHALLILIWFRPNVIFAKGGYVSVPIALVGWILRRPIVLHESDSIMGRANRFLLRFSKRLCIGAPQKEITDEEIMTSTKIEVTATGNPIRKELLTGSDDGGRRVTGFSGKKPIILIWGGSQGAQTLNEAVWGSLEQLLDLGDVIHLTGRGKQEKRITHARYFQRDVLYKELPNVLAFADVIVSRAGAGSIAELSALGKATILVPLPVKVQKHQQENAHFLEIANAVVVLDQDSLQETLTPAIREILRSDTNRGELGSRLHTFAVPDAAERIANILLDTART
jgi:UDP-N-acetylglucosamine--N-acetylmuramyl-(pentapeptide) pyrophosphoryl-undecaprenol N-acetylglucosamine transferase